jgi:hypothetical protein
MSLLWAAKSASGGFHADLWGDGSSGAKTYSSNTFLTTDLQATDVTVNASITLSLQMGWTSSRFPIVRATGTITINGIIGGYSTNGGTAGAIGGGTGGTGGGPGGIGISAGQDGGSDVGSGGAGAAGVTHPTPTSLPSPITFASIEALVEDTIGGGGGGGGGGSTQAGAVGGPGGGCICLIAPTIHGGTSGTINAGGGWNWGNPKGGGGSGGAGGGGIIILVCEQLTGSLEIKAPKGLYGNGDEQHGLIMLIHPDGEATYTAVEYKALETILVAL